VIYGFAPHHYDSTIMLKRALYSIGKEEEDNTWLVAALTTGAKARYRLRIAISAYPTCI